MFKEKISICFFVICFFISFTVKAHTDHQEIQVKSTFQVNDRKQLSSIEMVWVYDTFTSADMLSHDKDINRLAKVLVSDLVRFNFFTRINSGDKRLVANKINKYKLTKVTDKNNNTALQLSVTLLFNKPSNIDDLKSINIDHSDPTGRTILFYDKSDDLILTKELKVNCSTKVI